MTMCLLLLAFFLPIFFTLSVTQTP